MAVEHGQLVGGLAVDVVADLGGGQQAFQQRAGLEQGEYTYAVNPVYDRGEGDTRSTTVSALTVGGIDTDTNVAVFGAQGAIDIIGAAGQTVRIVTTDGRAVHTGTATESMRISAQAGIYIVKVGARAFKVTVK